MFAASEAAADRPYACSECGKNFCYSSVLLWHERAQQQRPTAVTAARTAVSAVPELPSCECTDAPTLAGCSISAANAARAFATAAASTCTKTCTSGPAAPAAAASYTAGLCCYTVAARTCQSGPADVLRTFRYSALRFHQRGRT